MAALSIDCRALRCPGPLMEIGRAIRGLAAGDTLRVKANDQAFCEDVRAWCDLSGNELVELNRTDGVCEALIRKN